MLHPGVGHTGDAAIIVRHSHDCVGAHSSSEAPTAVPKHNVHVVLVNIRARHRDSEHQHRGVDAAGREEADLEQGSGDERQQRQQHEAGVGEGVGHDANSHEHLQPGGSERCGGDGFPVPV